MTEPSQPGARSRMLHPLRVPLFTLVSVGLGILAHLGAGGSTPGLGVTALVTVTVWLCALVLGQGEQRLPALAAGMLAVQAGVHLALMHSWEAIPAHGVQPAASMAAENSPRMLTAHALLAFALAVWLRRGEAMLWRGAVAILPSLRLLDPPAVIHTIPSVLEMFSRPIVRRSRWRGPVTGLRGPPPLAA